jgi:hypothetical protein
MGAYHRLPTAFISANPKSPQNPTAAARQNMGYKLLKLQIILKLNHNNSITVHRVFLKDKVDMRPIVFSMPVNL